MRSGRWPTPGVRRGRVGNRPHAAVIGSGDRSEPVHVTYKFKPEASWTDNAPITADDFWYLWRQIVSQPGVVDPAGYDLITGVQSIDGGKTAVVTFSQPYPAWRELFSDILPAHIVKDVPGGFGAGLARTMPVTGGLFRVESIDPQRDEILLARNDRFWGQPAQPDQILFRRAGSPAALADSIRNGDTQVAQVHGSGVAFAQLSAIPQVRTGRIDTPRVLQLVRCGPSSPRSPTRRCARPCWVCSTSNCSHRSAPAATAP